MSDYTYHSVSSAKAFGGKPDEYDAIHQWMDRSRAGTDRLMHRMLAHHTQGIRDCVEHFGDTITISTGRRVSVQLLARQHVMEDLGFVPTLDHYAELLRCPRWASKPAQLLFSKINTLSASDE